MTEQREIGADILKRNSVRNDNLLPTISKRLYACKTAPTHAKQALTQDRACHEGQGEMTQSSQSLISQLFSGKDVTIGAPKMEEPDWDSSIHAECDAPLEGTTGGRRLSFQEYADTYGISHKSKPSRWGVIDVLMIFVPVGIFAVLMFALGVYLYSLI